MPPKATVSSTDSLRTLRRNSFFLYTAEIVPRLGALFIVPIWSARIVPAEYARWVLSLTTVEIILGMSDLGLLNFMIKVLFRYHDNRVQKYFGLAAKMVMACTSVVALLMAIFSSPLSHLMVDAHVRPDLFRFLAVYLLFAQFNNHAISYVQYQIQY